MAVNQANGIKSIQRGVITMTSPNATATATITSVDTAKSEVHFLGGIGNWSTPQYNMAYLEIVNSTTVRVTRGDGANAQVDVTYQVTEYY
jgi:hypothetical protein